MPKVSVIVPVYGVEKYIERCARSLFEQTLDDIEYIFVDDCTQDRSIDILKALIEEYRLRFAEMNYTVRIERMPTNSGQAAVRRHGIQLATGDYIIHCDSDDWVDRDMYRQMYEKAVEDGADMVVCDYYTHDGDKQLAAYPGGKNSDRVSFLKDILFQNISCAVWNKMVKREQYSYLQFYPTGNMGEDMVLIIQLAYHCKVISYVKSYLYYYYSNPNSITRQVSSSAVITKFRQFLDNYYLIETYISEKDELYALRRGMNWLRYSTKSMLYSADKTIRNSRKGHFPFVEYQVFFYPEVSKVRRKILIRNIIGSWIHKK